MRNLLPTTGQTTSYRDGDDGDFLAGLPGTTRFVDSGIGTVYDRHTGLTWIKQPELIIPGVPRAGYTKAGVGAVWQVQAARGNWANSTAYAVADLAKDAADSTYWICLVAHNSTAAPVTFAEDREANPTHWVQSVWTASAANLTTPATMIWTAAIDNALALTTCGFADWRLPNAMEIMSLFSLATTAKCLVAFFANYQAGMYWSGSTFASSTLYAWGAQFHPASGNLIEYRLKTNTATYIRPVRGGILNA